MRWLLRLRPELSDQHHLQSQGPEEILHRRGRLHPLRRVPGHVQVRVDYQSLGRAVPHRTAQTRVRTDSRPQDGGFPMIAKKQITVTIDGQKCVGEQGQTILQIATANSIHIPTLCYLKDLSSWGGCRMCIVEVAGSPKVVPSCATPAADGATYAANNDRLRGLRRLTLELLFSERNHICPICPMNHGDCELQQQGYQHGMDNVRYPYLYPSLPMDMSRSEEHTSELQSPM